VVTAIEGQIGVADCLLEMHAPCMQADTCTIRTPVEHIQERIVALLAGLSVAELHQMTDGAARAIPLAITG
jgi:DNA-binding IscR family transcriptional regulator